MLFEVEELERVEGLVFYNVENCISLGLYFFHGKIDKVYFHKYFMGEEKYKSLEEWSLPRIIVGADSIVVEEDLEQPNSINSELENNDISDICFRSYYVVSREIENEKQKIESKDKNRETKGKVVDLDLIISSFAFDDTDSIKMESNKKNKKDTDFVSGGLEKSVGGLRGEKDKGDLNVFYKVRSGAGDLYDTEEDNFYEELINEGSAGDFIDSDIRVDRSMLEIAGFRDEEAEKKREEKRRRW